MKKIYLDNSATSRFKPRNVIRTLVKWTRKSSNAGHGGHIEGIELSKKIWNVRSLINHHYNVGSEENVIFTKNCTEALNIVLHGLEFGDKNHVICSIFEHNSVLRPLKDLENRGKIQLTFVNPKENGIRITASDIEKEIIDKTALVCVCTFSNVTGDRNNIEEIGRLCNERGILFLVDDAQGAGHVRLNMTDNKINFVTFSGHKGFFAPQGIGVLCLNYKGKISPLCQGGTGTESQNLSMPEYLPERLESGTLMSSLILSLGEGIKYVEKNEVKIEKKVSYLSNYLIERLKKINDITIFSHDYYSSGVISIDIKGIDSTKAGEYLDRKCNIITRSGLHCAPLCHKYLNTLSSGILRISLNHKNNKLQLNKLIKSIKKCIKYYSK